MFLQIKHATKEFFINQILPRLFLGDFVDAESMTIDQVQCIISLSEASPHVADGITHIHAPIPDEMWLPPSVWNELVYALAQAVRDELVVLVHCRLGVSRSPALVVAYLAQCGWTIETALEFVKKRRSVVNIHHETLRGVMQWDRRD